MRQKIVGTYRLGGQMVQVVLREGRGGEGYPLPGDIDYPRIKIGADSRDWQYVVGVAMHEASELVASYLHYRYGPTNMDADDLLSLVFIMTHPQFSELCARVGMFLADCLPDLSAAWKKWKKEKK
ncbi:MAG: hypothetical protein LLG01_00670 [Planctomycetaceae bacterium]|nr:hypothetical protein [Planctomycetaceae bacterium]